ncbi:MAG: hypothetical protein E4H00_01635 [Myxococcales bacterium]|nr:MAG: hypothetical protein E4H00_01635 [Myxococcales bacterium]
MMGRLVALVWVLFPAVHAVAQATEVAPASDDPGPTWPLVKSVIGLSILLILAWLASHPQVRQRLEDALGVGQAVTSGIAFVFLGVLARHPAVGILDDEILYDLTPLVHFALGWLGLIIGFQFDVRVLDRLPRGTATLVGLETLTPFLLVGTTGAALMLFFGRPWNDATFVRDAIVLATAGAISATGVGDRAAPQNAQGEEPDPMRAVESLDEIIAVVGLAALGAFFRPLWIQFEWDLPGTVWLILSLGVGLCLGLIVYALLAGRRGSEFLALLLGSVALASGIAGYLFLSPLVVCFIAGALLVNLPGEHKQLCWTILTQLERPIYYLFFAIAGALWHVADWRGWALLVAFLASRGVGYAIARRILGRQSPRLAARVEVSGWGSTLFPPISMVSIAIVMSAQVLYRDPAIPWIVTAVIGGAIASELLSRRRRSR